MCEVCLKTIVTLLKRPFTTRGLHRGKDRFKDAYDFLPTEKDSVGADRSVLLVHSTTILAFTSLQFLALLAPLRSFSF
jgi:hypothetical protein